MNQLTLFTDSTARKFRLGVVSGAVLLALSACSGGSDENSSASGETTLSAAELVSDPRASLSFAQAVAAGEIDVDASDEEVAASGSVGASTETSTVAEEQPSLGAAAPDTEAGNSVDENLTTASPAPATTDSGDQDSTEAEPASVLLAAASNESTDTDTDSETQASTSSSPEMVDLSDTVDSESTIGQEFSSHTTDNFTGRILEGGSIQMSWTEEPTARGYNIYRDGDYITSVFDNEWLDTDTDDSDYYYEIEAFDFADNLFRVATGLTVRVRGTGREGTNNKTGPGVDLEEYELVFSDEFEGNSLDFSKWNTAYVWGPDVIINSEEQYYVDTKNDPNFGFDPFTFDGESLTINSIPTPDALSDKALGQPYLSGAITSRDSFNFTYGYAEARAKTPFGRGLWSAFWLLNTVYDRGDEPEIDIMEHIGHDQDVMYHTYHYYDHFEDSEVLHSTESLPVTGIDFTADFHTFGVDWRPGVLVFYVDGVETHRVTDSRVASVDMYVLANTALGGWWPGSPDATTEFPAQYELDYIRVYQKITPYDDMPLLNDAPSNVAPAASTRGTPPSRRPSFDQWPDGYPGRVSTSN